VVLSRSGLCSPPSGVLRAYLVWLGSLVPGLYEFSRPLLAHCFSLCDLRLFVNKHLSFSIHPLSLPVCLVSLSVSAQRVVSARRGKCHRVSTIDFLQIYFDHGDRHHECPWYELCSARNCFLLGRIKIQALFDRQVRTDSGQCICDNLGRTSIFKRCVRRYTSHALKCC